MVRDLRQILASMEKRFRQNPAKNRPIENHSNLSGTTTFKRVVMHLQTPPVGLALDRLAEIHQRGWSKKVLFVRYEDLTAQPKLTMQKVYEYLGVKGFQHHFDSVSQVTMEDDHVYGIPELHEIRPKVETFAHDYISILGKDAVRFTQSNFAWYFTLFGYSINPI